MFAQHSYCKVSDVGRFHHPSPLRNRSSRRRNANVAYLPTTRNLKCPCREASVINSHKSSDPQPCFRTIILQTTAMRRLTWLSSPKVPSMEGLFMGGWTLRPYLPKILPVVVACQHHNNSDDMALRRSRTIGSPLLRLNGWKNTPRLCQHIPCQGRHRFT
jgi:hypothetical protein